MIPFKHSIGDSSSGTAFQAPEELPEGRWRPCRCAAHPWAASLSITAAGMQPLKLSLQKRGTSSQQPGRRAQPSPELCISCCGAGTAADTDMTTQLISSNLELHSLSTGRLPRVVTANRMLKQMLFRYQGYIGAALVLGGVDVTGPHLYSIYPHGSTDKLPYVTMGSGSLAAMAVFEDNFKPDMEEEEAKQLVRDAIAAGIYNDLGSGSNIDLCVISKTKLDFLRPYAVPNKKGVRYGRYKCEKGTTAVLTEKVTSLELEVLDETVQTMDTS
uniref:Proteasome 20S subunit beta 7 n=1 Tax=Ornithorhynchus anatinus TaxID=9258 RepID=A0A6I8PEP4_ORNAN